jgi:hypothetical protein
MEIPKKFKVAGFDINVEFIDKLESNDYGNWCDVTNNIKLAKNISLSNGELTPLQDRQIKNTFLHELYHAFQFYSGKRYSEEECNIFANFMLEYFETKQ